METTARKLDPLFQPYFDQPGTDIKERPYASNGPLALSLLTGLHIDSLCHESAKTLYDILVTDLAVRKLGVFILEDWTYEVVKQIKNSPWLSLPQSAAILARYAFDDKNNPIVVEEVYYQPWYS